MLPAIVFIFSRAACDDAVRQMVRDGVRLTDAHERSAIRQVVERRVEPLDDDDLRVLGYDGMARGARAWGGRAPRRAGSGLPGIGGGVLRRGAAQGRLRHRDALARDQHASAFRRHRTLHQVRRVRDGPCSPRASTSNSPGAPEARARRRGPRRGGLVQRDPFAEAARVASAPPPDLRSAFRPTYNLAVNLVSRFDRAMAERVLERSFAQWQARKPDLLSRQLAHRIAILEATGYVEGWALTDAGHRLSRIYHEADLLVAEALGAGLFEGAEALGPGRRALGGRLRAAPGPAALRARHSGAARRHPPRPVSRTDWGSPAGSIWPVGARRWARWRSASGSSRRRTSCPGRGRRRPAWRPPWRRGHAGPVRHRARRGRPRRGGARPRGLRAHGEIRGRPGSAGLARRPGPRGRRGGDGRRSDLLVRGVVAGGLPAG